MKPKTRNSALFLHSLWALVFLFFIIAAVASCGGGGGGDDGGGGPGPGPVSGGYLFYFDSNGGLYAVDPSDPPHPVTVESTGTIGQYKMIFAGTWDSTNRQLTNGYLRYVVYIKDGRIYKVSALKSEGLAKSQASNETGITGVWGTAGYVCNSSTVFDWSDSNNSRFLYTLAGTDTNCNTTDDVKRMIRLGMSSTDSPLDIPAEIERVKDLMDRSNGRIFGWLVRNTITLKLQKCNSDFGSCVDTPPTNVQSAGSLGSDLSSNKEAVWYYNGTDTDFCIYDFVADTGVCPFGTVGNDIWSFEKDATGIYISYQRAGIYELRKLGFDGATVVDLASESYPIPEIALTDNRVIYFIDNGVNEMLKSVPKAGGATATLVSKPNSWSWPLPMLFTKGNRVFYNVDDNSAHFFAGYVLDDGSGAHEVMNALWIYFTLATALTNNDSNMPSSNRIVRTDGCAHGAPYCANGAMKSFDAGTYSSGASGIDIGTVPSGFEMIGLEGGWIGIGNDAVAAGWDSAQTDIFYFNADSASSLQRITNTPAVDEFPAFFFF